MVLPVVEVENLLLLPKPFIALAMALKFDETQANEKLIQLRQKIFEIASRDIERFAVDYTRRRIDRTTKSIGLASRYS